MDPRADNKINLAAKEFGSMIEAGGYLRGGRKWIKERNRKISPSFFWIFIYLAVSSQLQHVESSLHHAGYFVEEHGLSNCGTRSPECSGFSSCIVWAQLLHGMWDLSSLTRDWTCVPCIRRHILNHWTTREVPSHGILRELKFHPYHMAEMEEGSFLKGNLKDSKPGGDAKCVKQ